MGTSVDAPPPREYGRELQETLGTQIELAPQLYESEAKYRPQYAELDLQTLQRTLLGSPQQRGLLDLYEKDIYPALSRIETADRAGRTAGELDIIRQYAGDVTGALRGAAGNERIIAELQRQAEEELGAGMGLDPRYAAELEQRVRAGQAGRGLGFGVSDAVLEGATLASEADRMRRQRQAFAGGVAQLSQQTGGDPFLALLGRPSQNLAAGQGLGAQAQGFNPGQIFSPESQYAADIYQQNTAQQLAANTASVANRTALIGAGIQAAGSAIGGAGAGGMFRCWVARAVLGEENPAWLIFRRWLEQEAPALFRWAYVRWGERIAATVPRWPRWLYAGVRAWMEGIVRRRMAGEVSGFRFQVSGLQVLEPILAGPPRKKAKETKQPKSYWSGGAGWGGVTRKAPKKTKEPPKVTKKPMKPKEPKKTVEPKAPSPAIPPAEVPPATPEPPPPAAEPPPAPAPEPPPPSQRRRRHDPMNPFNPRRLASAFSVSSFPLW